MSEQEVHVGDLVRYNSKWIQDDGIEHTPRRIDKILRDEDTGVRYAYLVSVSSNPETKLVELSDIGESGEYEVVADE